MLNRVAHAAAATLTTEIISASHIVICRAFLGRQRGAGFQPYHKDFHIGN